MTIRVGECSSSSFISSGFRSSSSPLSVIQEHLTRKYLATLVIAGNAMMTRKGIMERMIDIDVTILEMCRFIPTDTAFN